jgi:uncharacterized protein (TIGR02996 family)
MRLMSVYFVYRCDEMGMSDRHIRRYDDSTLINWFRRNWKGVPDGDSLVEEFLAEVLEAGVPLPRTIADVYEALSGGLVAEMTYEKHCLQLLTDDDDPDRVYHVFDDSFVRKYPELTAFLLHEGPLPDASGPPGWTSDLEEVEKRAPVYQGEGEGRIYVLDAARDDRYFFSDLSAHNINVIDGLRLPELCRRVMTFPSIDEVDEWGHLFGQLREALIADDLSDEPHEMAFLGVLQSDPDDEATWRAYADWLTERGESAPGIRLLQLALPRQTGYFDSDPSKNVVRVGQHVVQAYIHSADGCEHRFLFDDLWGSAHSSLANALLRYATRWDVLSTGNEERE